MRWVVPVAVVLSCALAACGGPCCRMDEPGCVGQTPAAVSAVFSADAAYPDAAPSPDSDPTCVRACDRMRVLGCPEARSVPGGSSCIDVCTDAVRSHQLGNIDPACIAVAPDVAGVRKCGEACEVDAGP